MSITFPLQMRCWFCFSEMKGGSSSVSIQLHQESLRCPFCEARADVLLHKCGGIAVVSKGTVDREELFKWLNKSVLSAWQTQIRKVEAHINDVLWPRWLKEVFAVQFPELYTKTCEHDIYYLRDRSLDGGDDDQPHPDAPHVCFRCLSEEAQAVFLEHDIHRLTLLAPKEGEFACKVTLTEPPPKGAVYLMPHDDGVWRQVVEWGS